MQSDKIPCDCERSEDQCDLQTPLYQSPGKEQPGQRVYERMRFPPFADNSKVEPGTAKARYPDLGSRIRLGSSGQANRADAGDCSPAKPLASLEHALGADEV